MINIVSTFYITKYSSPLDNLRTKEIEACLLKNLESPLIEKIHLFVDDNEALNRLNVLSNNSDKISIIEVGKKPIYSDIFRYILKNLKDKICMIINADIYLLECEEPLIEKIKKEKMCYALTRHEYNLSKPLIDDYHGSHDAYMFNSTYIDENIINNHTNFNQDLGGIESHIIKNFCDLGFIVCNPCHQIKIVHLHASQLRNPHHAGKWIGLHASSDDAYHMKTCWFVPPIIIK